MAEKKKAEEEVTIETSKVEPLTREEAIQTPKTEVKVEGGSKEEQMKTLLERAQKILAEHGGMEANIGLNSEYWGLMNTYRTMMKE
jgi:hypothetical protein